MKGKRLTVVSLLALLIAGLSLVALLPMARTTQAQGPVTLNVVGPGGDIGPFQLCPPLLARGAATYQTIQKALDCALSGDTILVAAGTYNENVVINKDLTLRGATGTASDVIIDGSGGNTIWIDSPATDVVIEHLRAINGSGHGIRAWDTASGLDLTLNNFETDNNGTFGLALKNISSLTMTGGSITNNWYGIYAVNVSLNLSDVDMSGNSWDGIYSELGFLTVTGSDIGGNRYGINVANNGSLTLVDSNSITNNLEGIRVDATSGSTLNITNNDLSGNTNYAINNLSANTATATDNYWGTVSWYGYTTSGGSVEGITDGFQGDVDFEPWTDSTVLDGGSPSYSKPTMTYADDDDDAGTNEEEPGSYGGTFGYDAFSRIQDAINNLSASTVQIGPGTYSETITLSEGFTGLSIVGDGTARPEVDGGIKFENTSPINGVSIENLYLKGNASGGAIIKCSNTAVINDFVMDNCVLDGENAPDEFGPDGRYGLAGNHLGGSFSITNTEFRDILGWAVVDIDYGTGDFGSDTPLSSITFSGNIVDDCNGSVALRGNATTKTGLVTVRGNYWDDIGENGGEQGEQWAAVEVNHAIEAIIVGNRIANVKEGLYGEGEAVQLWDIDTMSVHSNVLTNNYQGIFIWGGGGNYAVPAGSIFCNNIVHNSLYGIDVDPAATGGPLDATYNWWGDASGPYHVTNPGGTGNSVSDNVDYEHWLPTQFEYSPKCGFAVGGEVSPTPTPVAVGGTVEPVNLSELSAASDQQHGGNKTNTSLTLWIGLASGLAIVGGFLALRRRRAR